MKQIGYITVTCDFSIRLKIENTYHVVSYKVTYTKPFVYERKDNRDVDLYLEEPLFRLNK